METQTISLPIYQALHCEERKHCATCRTDRAWRRQHVAFYGGKIDFECALNPPVPWPDGFTPSDEIQPKLAPDRPQRPVAVAEPVEPPYAARFPLPGEQLTAIFKAAEIEPKPGCQCRQHAAQMDRWWIELEKAHPDAIRADLMTRFVASHGATIIGWLTAEAVRSRIIPNPVKLWKAVRQVTGAEIPNESTGDTCRYLNPWAGPCGKPAGNDGFCDKHHGLKCIGCGKQATRGCSFSGQFVCGEPLCDTCNHAHS